MNAFITTLSLIAVVVSVTGNLPQLATMARSRSAGGQSVVGWALGAAANVALAVVNLLGTHAVVIGTGNLLSLTACLCAIVLIRRFRGTPVATEATEATTAGGLPAGVVEDPVAAITDMQTGQLAVLSQAVIAEHHRRIARREAMAA